MRYLFLLFMLSCVHQLKATNYYFSSSSGDDSRSAAEAQRPFTPWKSIAKLNAILSGIVPGDSILFKSGDMFEGGIIVTRSGNGNQPIVFASYGEGAKPVISGLTTVTNWRSAGGNVYEAEVPSTTMINLMLINQEMKPIGRYPNTNTANKGWLSIESYNGNTQITDNELQGFPDWTGGEAVIRKNRWVIDRTLITRHSGNIIQYSNGSPNNAATNYGYFIQNHPRTLDMHGEWFYNVNEKKLGVYLTSGNPANAGIQVSTVNTLVSIYNQSNITFQNIAFKGANQSAFQVHNGSGVSIINCDITFSGYNAITATNVQQMTIASNVIDQTNNIAIHQENCSYTIIRNNRISNTGMIAGMGEDDSGSYEAIMLTGDNHLIEGNRIENTGYIPITFRGNSNIIRNNFINVFAAVKDDGSGIYSWNNIPNAPLTFGSKIINNVILNGKGAGEGTDNPAYVAANGIYMDDNTANVEITGNTVANNPLHGIYIHNAHEITISNNTLFNNGSQVALVRDGIAAYSAVRNINMQHNIFVSKEVSQPVAEFSTHENDLNAFGTFDNNYYARPANDNFTIRTAYVVNGSNFNKSINLADWKQLYGKDAASKQSPVTVTTKEEIRFEYNDGATQKTIALDKEYVDIKNNNYAGSIKLEPYSSVVLLPKQAPSPGEGLCPSTGSITREQWDNVIGNDVANIPVTRTPSATSTLSRFETVQIGDNYAARIRGYICPPLSGAYTFFISGDDAVELWLSTDDNPANRKKIAGILSYTEYNEWNKFPGQTSARITLQAGQRYYVEVLHKEGGGGDHVSVGWQMPSGTKEMPIPGNRLAPFGSIIKEPIPEPQPDPQPQPLCTGTGGVLREVWLNVTGSAISDIPLTRAATSSNMLTGLQTADVGDNYAERLRGYLCVPVTGNYTFFISGDDAVELWVSTDDNPLNRKRIANILSYTNVNEWNKYSSQTSAPVYLSTGRRYYIEVLHKEGGGGDHLTVGWQLPNGVKEIPVAGNRLSPFTEVLIPEQPALCSATGSILREQWNNVTGNDISNIPLSQSANSNTLINSLQTADLGDNYGARMRGFICPPQTGNYTFYISGDDAAELWLSTDDNPNSKRKIAFLLSYTGLQEYNSYGSQTSAAVTLQQGKKYYIEVLHKEGGGGDHVSVGWQLPDGVRESPVPGSRLSPVIATPITPTTPVPACVATGNILQEQWLNIAGTNISDIPLHTNPNNRGLLSRLQTYGMGDLYGLRLRGYVCPPMDGNYTFSVAGDDAVELWLSTSDDPLRKVRIVNLISYTNFQDWSKYPSQISAPVSLKAGNRYYIEVLQKEGYGSDHISIGWTLPNRKDEFPIGGDRLSPYQPSSPLSSTGQGIDLTEMALDAKASISAYPSPFYNSTSIKVNPNETGDVKIELYDLHGKLVKKIFSGRVDAGVPRTFTMQGENLPAGVYIIRMVTGREVYNQKVTRAK